MHLARSYIVCKIGSDSKTIFWHDNWTDLCPLIDIAGEMTPHVIGIPYFTTVSQAVSGVSLRLPRGRHQIVVLLQACLPARQPQKNICINGKRLPMLLATSSHKQELRFGSMRRSQAHLHILIGD